MESNIIEITNINKIFNDQIIFKDFNIEFDKGKINCILGKSGCGKSTLLNIISGLMDNDTVDVRILNDINISYIFQEDRLLDWLTVEENIKLVGRKYYNKNELDIICDKYLNLVGALEYKNYYPQKLSGGLRQRVNIIRALIYKSDIILMDEPFKSLDIKNKQFIMSELKNIIKIEQRTVIFVTHDIEEAKYMADKIFVLEGRPIKIKKKLYNNSNLEKDYISQLI